MGKILITLKVPSVEQKFDVLVPDFLPVKEMCIRDSLRTIFAKKFFQDSFFYTVIYSMSYGFCFLPLALPP